MSLGARIFIGVVLIQLLSAAGILGGFLYSIQSDLHEVTELEAEEAVLQSIETVEAHFLPAERAVLSARGLLAQGVVGRDRPARLERYLIEQLRHHPAFAGIFVGYPDGGFHYVSRSDREAPDGTRTKVIRPGPESRDVALTWRDAELAVVKAERDPQDSYDPRTRAWYAAALEQRASTWTEPYPFFTSRKPGITTAAAVRDSEGAVTAVVGVDIEMDEISSFLTQVSLGFGGSAYIVAPGDHVVAHSSFDLVLRDDPAIEEALRFRKVAELGGFEGALGTPSDPDVGSGASVALRRGADGVDRIVAVGRVSEVHWPWRIVVIAPAKGLADSAHASNMILIAVILLATGLASALAYALSRSIGRPLAALHRNALAARQGNLEMMEEVASGYREIVETGDALADLAEQRRKSGNSNRP